MDDQIQKILDEFVDRLTTAVRKQVIDELQSLADGTPVRKRRGRPPGTRNKNGELRKKRKPLSDEQKDKLRENLAKAREVRLQKIAAEKAAVVKAEKAASKRKPAKRK